MEGTLYWITGLAGAGKTTIGKLLYSYLKEKKQNVVMMDGDILREVEEFNDYTAEGREKSALLYSYLYKSIVNQGIDVVCCTISMFNSCRDWNRNNIKKYKEIYLKVPIEELIARDQKQLYSKALKKEISNVIGIDLEYEEPKKPDLVIENYGENNPNIAVKHILNEFNL